MSPSLQGVPLSLFQLHFRGVDVSLSRSRVMLPHMVVMSLPRLKKSRRSEVAVVPRCPRRITLRFRSIGGLVKRSIPATVVGSSGSLTPKATCTTIGTKTIWSTPTLVLPLSCFRTLRSSISQSKQSSVLFERLIDEGCFWHRLVRADLDSAW
jgi:hypothetical protein